MAGPSWIPRPRLRACSGAAGDTNPQSRKPNCFRYGTLTTHKSNLYNIFRLLNSTVACGIVNGVRVTDFTSPFMRLSSLQRLGTALCGTFLLCLFSVAAADAAPSHGRVASHKQCDSEKVTPCRAKARASKARPASKPYAVRVQRLVHRQPGSSWLERSRPDPLRANDDAALQDRTAVGSGEDDLLLASLQPLGVLGALQRPISKSAVVSRHSPRGPPRAPGFV
jgi:hypothetical protein